MAFRVNKTVEWKAGEGTPVKYSFSIDVMVSVISVVGNTATIRVNGSYGVQNNPTNSRNSFAASDFAILAEGGSDPWTYPFTYGQSYYQSALPFATNAPQTVLDGILIEFRGDTWISDPVNNNNRSTLYDTVNGVVLNEYDGSTYQSFNINTTFTVDISGGNNVPILTWVDSGAGSSTDYTWMQHQVWVSWFDLDYRPGATLDTGTSVWKSHNRAGGTCHGYNGSRFLEMRTIGAPTAKGNPPSIYHDSAWFNQRRIGKE